MPLGYLPGLITQCLVYKSQKLASFEDLRRFCASINGSPKQDVSKHLSEIAQADECAAQDQEGLVDVRSLLVANAKTPATGEPCQRPLHHPPVAS